MRIHSVCAALLALALGCGIDEEPTSSAEQSLFSVTGVRFWDTDRQDGMGVWWRANTIPVCFQTGLDENGEGFNGDSSMVANFETYRTWMRDAVEDSWARVAHLRFVNWGPCPERVSWRMAGWVAIYWLPEGTGGGSSKMGYLPSMWTRMKLGRPLDLSDSERRRFQAVVRHEFGHAIGFQHEKDRADYTGPVGTSTSSAVCERDAASGTGWTEVYDPTSIMNYGYCQEAGLGELSAYDIYGVQKVYGRKPSGSIVGLRGRCVNTPGFNYANGTQLQVYDCYGQSNDTWARTLMSGYQTFAQRSSPYTASVLSSRAPHHYWGTATELQTYWGNTSNNIWKLKGVLWKAIGDLCVVPRRSDLRLVITYCYDGDNWQLWDWDYGVKGRIRNVGTGLCANVAYGSSNRYTPINLYPCGDPQPYPNEVFTTTPRGEIKYAGMCLNVANYFPVSDAELQLYECAAPDTPRAQLWYNELFHLSGRIMHAFYEDALTIQGGVSVNGALLQTYPYSAAPEQQWDVYF